LGKSSISGRTIKRQRKFVGNMRRTFSLSLSADHVAAGRTAGLKETFAAVNYSQTTSDGCHWDKSSESDRL